MGKRGGTGRNVGKTRMPLFLGVGHQTAVALLFELSMGVVDQSKYLRQHLDLDLILNGRLGRLHLFKFLGVLVRDLNFNFHSSFLLLGGGVLC
jgi:hypothetical protein